MKTLLSLFDYSGTWSEPFMRNGWEVIQWDIKLAEFMDITSFTDYETTMEMLDGYDIQGIIAGPPCTDFTVSGNQYWSQKDAAGQTKKSLEFVLQVLRLVDALRPTDPDYFDENPDSSFFWAIENPVGRMARLAGLDDAYWFNPCDFAGHTNPTLEQIKTLDRIRSKNGKDVTDQENEAVLEVNAYTKKTGLWGQFNRDLVKMPIAPIKTCKAGSPLMRLGGKSARTKELRSNTPAGFAEAFYEANKNYQAVYE